MDPGHLFAARVRRPTPSGLPRDRLTRRVLGGPPCAVALVAPAGAGKTTLLAEAAQCAAPRVAWYRAGAQDGGAHLLVRYLARALGPLLPPGSAPDGIDGIHALVAALEHAGPLLLVLDDVHELDGTPAAEALAELIDLRPPDVRLLLGTRRPLALASGPRVTTLDAEDLRFRSWEVEQLFAAVYGEPLAPEAAAVLSRRTAGWAAGLQLFHLATAGKQPQDRVRLLHSLSGQARVLRPYLTRNVLADLSPERRRFLVRTCALGRLTGPLCDALLDTSGSDAVLRELEQRQLFTTSVGDGESFRYHEVLRSHLELVLVEEVGEEAARAWHGRAARVLEAAGAAREALLACARAEDWGAVARLVQLAGPELGGDDGCPWDELVPDRLWRTDAWLSLAEAHRRVRHGELAGAVEALVVAEGLFGDPGARHAVRRQRRAVVTWTVAGTAARAPVPQALAGGTPPHWAEVLRAATRALPVRPPDEPLAAGLVCLLAGRFADAARLLREQAVAAGGRELRTLADAGATVAELLTGQLPDPVRHLEAAALRAELADQPWLAHALSVVRCAVVDVPGPPVARDAWGSALTWLVVGAGDVVRGRDAELALHRAQLGFEALSAPVPAVWARALRGLSAARSGGGPAALENALAAAAASRAAAVPGARAVAAVAVALCREGDPAQREAAARAAALPTGLPVGALIGSACVPRPRAPELPVRVRLLGGFVLTVGEVPVDLAAVRPRARALLRLLALHAGEDVHREGLIDALWREADPAAGLRGLHVALSSLRQALEQAGLGGAVLVRAGEAYRLAVPGVAVDLRAHEAAVRAAADAGRRGAPGAAIPAALQALRLYTGDLLPEDGPAEWVVGERERVRAQAAATAEQLAVDCLAVGRLPEALLAGRRAVELDPATDRAFAVCAEVHERRGERAAAASVRMAHARAVAELTGGDGLSRRRAPSGAGGARA